MNKNLVGRCGLYCGYCSVYRAYKDSKKLQEEIAEKNNCRPEEVRCEGCQKIDVVGWSGEKDWGRNCRFLKCLNSKKLRFCYECTKYEGCQKFDELATACSELGIDLRKNLRIIREGRVDEWLLEQDGRHRCPNCKNPIIVSQEFKTCHWCGYKLRDRMWL